MYKIVVCIFILALRIHAVSDEALGIEKPREHENGVDNGIGAGGAVFYSWGFLYRHHFDNRFGFSTSVGGWFDNYRGHLGNNLALLYSIAHHAINWSAMPNASIRVYLSANLSTLYRLDNEHKYIKIGGKEESVNKKHSWDIGLGAGPGVEFFFNRYFSLHAELPWMTFVKIADRTLAFRDSYPHFGGGFVYYF